MLSVNQYIDTLEKVNFLLEKISGEDLDYKAILKDIAYTIESIIPELKCSIMIYDEKTKTIGNAIGPSLPSSYLNLIDGTKIGPNVGSCGTAAYYGKTVFVSDIARDPLWDDYKTNALKYGLHSCWSKPIFSATQKLLGTFALYSDKPRNPTEEELVIVEKFTSLSSLAIERKNTSELQQKYQILADNMSELIHIVDLEGNVKFTTQSSRAILGISVTDMYGTSVFTSIQSKDQVQARKLFNQIITTKQSNQVEFDIMNAYGELIPCEVTGSPILCNSGEVEAVIIVARNIKERKTSELALRESEERYRQLIELSPDAVVVFDKDQILYINNSGASLLGYSEPDQLNGIPIDMIIHEDDIDSSKLLREQVIDKKVTTHVPINIKVYNVNREIMDVEVLYRLIEFQEKLAIQAICRDITERKKTEERMKFLAYHDPLTQLPNRSKFTQECQTALEFAKRNNSKLALLFLDIDNFKMINDTYGHSQADSVLIEISNRLKRIISNGVLARVSGDEFSILLKDINTSSDIENYIKRILNEFNKNIIVDGKIIRVTTSMGISQYPSDGEKVEKLLNHADLAMYIAKKNGKNTYQFYTDEINLVFLKRRKLEKEIRCAMNENQFLLYYQPIINCLSEEIEGVEALLRWKHPSKGIIGPHEFIPYFEETGLINQVGEWVLFQACKQVNRWRKAGLPHLNLNVNLSVKQLNNEDFVHQLKKIIIETNFDADSLQLEITESIMMHETEETIKIIKEIKELGVQIAIDDFGKGFSSLSYLTSFPFDILKIDRSFIARITDDPKTAGIVETIINLANVLDLNVVAEGVETTEQLSFLKRKGCLEAQGYLFSKPVPPHQIMSNYVKNKLHVGR
ncbi:EAL domain-containing protein [Bacillus alkalicellulosilyticus]|uniref:sensor domain-containing phosphodiesterase n=1 Tax=Alkalihalobacterium alkalicellulosilyticum TaxID=1912214 RepID=UPI0009985E0B|nr:EAL domain-containing protein [Bacillus alkalicellulosilyticus]